MKYPRYEYSTEENLFLFEFESVGIKGKVRKVVQYAEMSVKGFYNLGFGDYNEETKEIDDEVVTNNGDGLKVLSTVVSTLYAFTGKYPKANVFATGSSEARTRLYRMGITNNLEELKQDFFVYGLRKDEIFEEFVVGEDYLGFLVTRKNKNFKI
ncbi:MAG: hypothetical protein H6604_02290 [Flavobacteriales bacterium]|nr:hypothetical protein [Flavobacteriales bacterium]